MTHHWQALKARLGPLQSLDLTRIVCWLALRLGCSANTQDMLELFSPFLDGYAMNLAGRVALETSDFFRLLTSRAGRKWAYANEDVKAYFLCQIRPHEQEIWLGSGPAACEDAPLKIIHEI